MLVAAVIVLAAAWSPLQAFAFTALVRATTGVQIDASSVALSLDGFTLEDARVRAPHEPATLQARRVVGRFHFGGSPAVELDLDAPHFTLPIGRLRNDLRLLAAHLGGFAGRGASLTFHGGTVTLDTAADPAPVLAVDGSAEFAAGQATWDLHGSSDALPLEALIPSAGGSLANLSFSVDASRNVTARAEVVGGVIPIGPQHRLANLAGALVVDGDAIGSRLLTGKLDDAPIEMVGEVHGYAKPGATDLARIVRLLRVIAAERNLQDVRLEATAPGVAFAKYHLNSPDDGRLAIHVASVNPSEPTLHLDSALADDHIISGGERTSTMGQRTGAVLGVDGDYFDIGGSYAPQGILVHAGRLLHSPTKRYALTVHPGNRVTFDEYRFHGSLRTIQGTYPVTSFNEFPVGQISVITPDYGKVLRAKPGQTFVALEPTSAANQYRVLESREVTEPIVPAFGIAIGAKAGVPPLHPGEIVGLSYDTNPSVRGVVAAVGSGPLLVHNGAWFEDPDAPAPDERDVRWPVVGVGKLSDDSLLFLEVDGRWPDISVGMTRPEFGALMLRYKVVEGMAFDSGGSAVIVARAPGDSEVSVRSHPSDQSYERYVTDALFVYSSAPPPSIVPRLSAERAPCDGCMNRTAR
ncbi:MAG: phosphodiester glycosidase family protein [Candidatus Eremiobacteraeota bacterium]|nr:phosphodiester glycosidase family protein [Candidatus Eremiobacteraeota bacterium]